MILRSRIRARTWVRRLKQYRLQGKPRNYIVRKIVRNDKPS
ncbi:unnamed protein product [Brassica rapa subsp. trilocularis]